MYGIKKIFGVMFLIAMIVPQTVLAAKQDLKEKNYNFQSVRRILLMNPTSNVSLISNNSALAQKISSIYQENSKYLKCEVLTENQIGNLEDFSQTADVVIKCNIKDWGENSRIVPEQTIWEQKTLSRRVLDDDGDWIEEDYEAKVPVVHPPYRTEVSKIEVIFEVYDTKTGNLVFKRRDVREREEKNSQDGMYRRLCYQFFQDFGKIIG